MSKQKARDEAALVYGSMPRANLMPPEVAQRKRETSRRRGLISIIALVLVLTLGGVVGVTWLAGQSQQRLDDEQAITQELLTQQLEYSEVLGIQSRLADVDAQRALLASVEIEWRAEVLPYLSIVERDGIVRALVLQANDPFQEPAGLAGPLRSPQSATVVISVVSRDLPEAPRWLRAFESIDTYADASLDTVQIDGADEYLTTITLNLNSTALLVPPTEEEAE